MRTPRRQHEQNFVLNDWEQTSLVQEGWTQQGNQKAAFISKEKEMSKEKKDNSGAAFLRNSDNAKAPWASGPVMIGGKEYEVAIWKQKSQKGDQYLSLKFGPPYVPKNKKQETNEDPDW